MIFEVKDFSLLKNMFEIKKLFIAKLLLIFSRFL